MSENDITNLIFILSASPETIMDWWSKVSEDDHQYAMELLARYSEILQVYTENLGLPDTWLESQSVLGKIMHET